MIVDIRAIRDGMVLRTEVRDDVGRILLPAGCPLKERYIEKLERWSVRTVDVEGAPDAAALPVAPGEAAMDEAAVEEIDRRLANVFASVMDDPWMAEIRRLAREHLSRNRAVWRRLNS